MDNLLSWVIFLPLLGAIPCFFMGASGARAVALVTSLVAFVASIPLWTGYDPGGAAFQFVDEVSWLPDLGISYAVGIDGISLWLVLLTTFVTPLALYASWTSIETKVKEYALAFLLL